MASNGIGKWAGWASWAKVAVVAPTIPRLIPCILSPGLRLPLFGVYVSF